MSLHLFGIQFFHKNLFKLMRVLLILSVCFLSICADAQVNLKAGLNAYYKFSGNLNDSSGAGNHATGRGGIGYTTDRWGKPNSAGNFDGVDDWMFVASNAGITMGSKMTISFQFKTKNKRGQVLISKSDTINNANYKQFQVGINYPSLGDSGLMLSTEHDFDCITTSGTFNNYSFSKSTIDTNWHCAIMVFDSSYKRIYLDGLLVANDTVKTGNMYSIDSCNGGVLKIGSWWQSDPQSFDGQIDEIRIYKRILNTQERDSVCKNVQNPTDEEPQSVANTTLNNIGLYPNPLTGNTLYLDHTGEIKYAIYNIAGQMLQTGKLQANDKAIYVRELATGVYILKAETNEGVWHQRFVKQ
ncbi:hypothetical protein CAP35_12850 [Chitinophagaceae bacterium IBVUCB1]|nr:hypothetical protein CAP35_12850 [Chitinophagaceae bacterium IBVUCB1]